MNRSKLAAVILAAVILVSGAALVLYGHEADEPGRAFPEPLSDDLRNIPALEEAEKRYAESKDAFVNSGPDGDSMAEAYGELVYSYFLFSDWTSLKSREYYLDPMGGSDFLEWSEKSTAMRDDLLTTARDVASGPDGEALMGSVPGEDWDYILDYAPMSPEELELTNKESRLEDEYIKCSLEEYTAEHDGTAYTRDQVLLSDLDVFTKYSLLEEIERKFNEAVVPILIQLVDVRNGIAELNGYDSYAEYSYEEMYDRGFSPEMSAEMYGNVHEHLAPVMQELLLVILNLDAGGLTFDGEDDVLTAARPVLDSVDPLMSDLLDYMLEEDLISFDYTGKGMDTALTSRLLTQPTAWMYISGNGGYSDLSTFIHEFGHASQMCLNPSNAGSLDVMELDSQGLEMLSFGILKDTLGEDWNDYVGMSLYNTLANVVTATSIDEFEQTLYSTPDLTVEKVNELADRTLNRYGPQYSYSDYGWVNVSHLFTSPMYYISYSLSGFSALGLLTESMDDWDGARDRYVDLLLSDNRGSYMDVVEAAGIRDVFNGSDVEEVSEDLRTYIRGLVTA